MVNSLRIIIIVLLSVSVEKAHARNKPISRILNGWEALPGDAPYQVAFKLYEHEEYHTICGGSILTADVVLTAAHCLVETPTFWQRLFFLERTIIPLSGIYAVAGSLRNVYDKMPQHHISELDGQWRTIRSVHCPRSYGFPSDDISIVFISEPFIFNYHVNYIPYTTRDADYVGTCLASGFGQLNEDNEPMNNQHPDTLMLGNVKLVRTDECSSNLHQGTWKLVCASHKSLRHTQSHARRDASTSPGDSGGPLVCSNTNDPKENSSRGILVGVTSGSMSTDAHHYAVFTRVSAFADYIHAHINGVDFGPKITTITSTILFFAIILLF